MSTTKKTTLLNRIFTSMLLISACAPHETDENVKKITNFLSSEEKTRKSNGQPYFIEFEMGECKQNCKELNKLTKREFYDETLELKCSVLLNCLDRWVYPKISNDTLYIDFNINDSIVAACDCYFNFEGKIKNVKTNPNVIIISGQNVCK